MEIETIADLRPTLLIAKQELWRPPEMGSIKINFDASFHAASKGSISGAIARNDSCQIMGACTFLHIGIADAFIAEGRACERAVIFAVEMGFRAVQIEGDSLTTIKKSTQKQRIDRDANTAAHVLAGEGRWFSEPMYWVELSKLILSEFVHLVSCSSAEEEFRKIIHLVSTVVLNSPTEGTDDRPLPAMADAQTEKPLSLSEQYALQEKEEKSDVTTKPAEAKEAENPVNAATGSGDVVTEKLEETSADPVEGSTDAPPPTAEESTEANPATGNSGEDAAEENSGDSEETPEIKSDAFSLFSLRLPQQISASQLRTKQGIASHDILSTTGEFVSYGGIRVCFFWQCFLTCPYPFFLCSCVAAKGEGAPECDKFAKYYRALCPGEWIDRWNEQRENGTFPGPL
ncbi:Cytochrome c oxidase, subunit VIb [Gossypium australe]|uniref:Cytochrome c oxidase, subunit VIb n=1 Tax=Gossypium australe TaxID=47621 RepID=A0A5B6U9E1_9ROSI|nr:Cytochrome c oxidase, subunit VIb [Gossypium australe]